MDQIRKTMMQHETLFKEQVQALHKLYSIQKMVMQECKRRNHYGGQAKVLAFTRKSVVLVEDQFSGSVSEGRPLMPVFGSDRAQKEGTLALSLHPFCAFKDFEVPPRSLGIDGLGVGSILTAESKPMRNFDLERLPEDYVDGSEIQVWPDRSHVIDAKSTLSERKENAIQVDPQSSKQMCEGRNFLGSNMKKQIASSKETSSEQNASSDVDEHV